MTNINQDLIQWQTFLAQHPKIEFIWLQFLSYTSMTNTRMVPVSKFTQMVEKSEYFSIPSLAWSIAPGGVTDGISPCGVFRLRPDISSSYCQAGSNGTRAVIQCYSIDSSKGTNPLKACPRTQLHILQETLRKTAGFSLLIGFEIELVFLKTTDAGIRVPITNNDGWSCIDADEFANLNMIESIVRALSEVGISLEHFHTEAGPGQWEFVLPPDTPIRAVDTLLKARDTITNITRLHGVQMTLYPRISKTQPSTGAHVHISLNRTSTDHTHNPETPLKPSSEAFFGGVIHHMPSILAYTLPQDISYDRVRTGIFSGGEYACWGWENKDTSLRRIADNRFEFKLMDGFANPYLALSAIIAAGLDGLTKGIPLRGGHCNIAAAKLSAEERETLGVNILLPKTLDGSFAALQADQVLREYLGDDLVLGYIAVKRREINYLREMTDDERKDWLISRY
ncbi:hypothetical protein TWF730_008652 [Orbilia blumenaviensis]|uniref:GS catalytic domain-containing protein n=1 Tax=Orbilia blumenaviensis TaxID=1796055 RepID=A0AAV9V3S7_9PEZI